MRCEIERSSLLARAIHVSTQLINLPDIVIFAHTWHETRISRFNSCISFVLWKNVRRMMAKDHEEDVFDKQEDCRLTMEERREAKWGGLHIQIAPQAFCLESVRRTALKNCGVVLLVEQRQSYHILTLLAGRTILTNAENWTRWRWSWLLPCLNCWSWGLSGGGGRVCTTMCGFCRPVNKKHEVHDNYS
jgi:hypothetical protein